MKVKFCFQDCEQLQLPMSSWNVWNRLEIMLDNPTTTTQLQCCHYCYCYVFVVGWSNNSNTTTTLSLLLKLCCCCWIIKQQQQHKYNIVIVVVVLLLLDDQTTTKQLKHCCCCCGCVVVGWLNNNNTTTTLSLVLLLLDDYVKFWSKIEKTELVSEIDHYSSPTAFVWFSQKLAHMIYVPICKNCETDFWHFDFLTLGEFFKFGLSLQNNSSSRTICADRPALVAFFRYFSVYFFSFLKPFSQILCLSLAFVLC